MGDFLPKTPVIHVVGVVQGQEENNVKGDIIMKFGFRTPSFKEAYLPEVLAEQSVLSSVPSSLGMESEV